MIKIYSTPTCSSCRALKQFFKEKSIEYEEIDLSKLTKEELEKTIERLDSLSVPVIEFVDGSLIKGFDMTLIKEKLKME
jgi:glutaredoxin